MPMKKWYWLLAIIASGIIIIFFLIGQSGSTVSNLYFIPAGTFGLFPDMKIISGNVQGGNDSVNNSHIPQVRKLMDAEVLIYEWNVSVPDRYKRNITIIHVSEKDFRDYPELERTMLNVKGNPPLPDGNQSHFLKGFQANLSDYNNWLLDSICKDKTRLECYDDLPVFEYHGRYYDIGVAFF